AGSVAGAALRDAGIPVYATVEAAADALSGAVALRDCPGRPPATVAPARPAAGTGYWAARALLRDGGVTFKPAREVSDRKEAAAAAIQLAAPYVLKAAWLSHKSESGGVRVGLADAAAVIDAFDEMHGRLGNGPYVLEEQDVRCAVVEMIIGARRDPGLGPMVMVGAGGTEAELYRDVATECAPVDLDRALAMVRGLRCAPLLAGWRGRPAVDVESLARAVVAVSDLVTRLAGAATEVEVNPIRVGADGAIAVDALLVPTDDGQGSMPGCPTAQAGR
ncbi:MAG: acetate--CoA ligase family protein, partial [Streptosporangiaceae bacterium]